MLTILFAFWLSTFYIFTHIPSVHNDHLTTSSLKQHSLWNKNILSNHYFLFFLLPTLNLLPNSLYSIYKVLHESIYVFVIPRYNIIALCFLLFCFVLFFFLWPTPMAYGSSQARGQIRAMAATMWDPSHVCNLHHSSWQCQILNPLSETRNWTCNLMETSFISAVLKWELPIVLVWSIHVTFTTSLNWPFWLDSWTNPRIQPILKVFLFMVNYLHLTIIHTLQIKCKYFKSTLSWF